ncbi:uncharacterized protein [Lepisosteus oculatus]|uniref:uncharacterized protein isoform X1 n=2 Tax=Lepisosteus oculatus TaxID=7918 RepID=UPI0035F4FF7E
MYRGRPSRDGGPDRCWDGTPCPPRGRGHPDSDSTAVPMRRTDRDYCPLAMGFPEQGGMSVGPPDHRGPSRPSRMFWDSPSHHVGMSPGPGSGSRPCAGREAVREPPDRGRLRATDVLIVPGSSEDLSDQVFEGTVTRDLRSVQANEESQEGALPGRIEAKVYGGDKVLMFGEDDSNVALMQGDRVQFNIVKSLSTQLRRATNIAVLPDSFCHTREAREMDESAGQEKGARVKKLPENSSRTPFEQRFVEVVEKKSTLAAPTVTKDKEKWKAVTPEVLPQRTVVFEDVGTKLYDGVVIKPTVKLCNTKQIAGPESFPGRVLVRINGSDQELPFGARDLQTEMTVFEGDHVQFNISTNRSTGAERAINIEILPDTFQFTKETRETGVVVDTGASCGFIKCKRSPRMFFCLSEVMGEDRLCISDEVEFTAVHVASDDQRDQAVRIKKLKNAAIPSSRSESETVDYKAREKKKMSFKFLKDSIGPSISNLKVNLGSFDEENAQELFHRGEDHGDIDLQGLNPEYRLQQEKRSREFAEENDMVSEYGMDPEVLRRSSDTCRPTEWIEDTRLRGHSRSRSSEHSWSHSKKHSRSRSRELGRYLSSHHSRSRESSSHCRRRDSRSTSREYSWNHSGKCSRSRSRDRSWNDSGKCSQNGSRKRSWSREQSGHHSRQRSRSGSRKRSWSREHSGHHSRQRSRSGSRKRSWSREHSGYRSRQRSRSSSRRRSWNMSREGGDSHHRHRDSPNSSGNGSYTRERNAERFSSQSISPSPLPQHLETSNSYWNLEFASKKRELEILEKHIAQKRTLIDRENSHQGLSGRTTEAGDFRSFRAVEDDSYRKRFPAEAGGYMQHPTAPALPVKPILKKPNDPGMEPDFNNKNNGSEASEVKRSSNLSMQIERFLNTLNKGVDSGLLSTLLREAREESSVPETSRPVPQHSFPHEGKEERSKSQEPEDDFLLPHEKASKDSSGFSRILGIKHDLLSSEENWKGFLHIEDEEKFLYGEDASTNDLHPKSDMSKRQSPAAVKEEEGEDEDAAQNYDKIQTLLRTIGLDIGVAEVSKLAMRTQERLYGKKLKSKSCDSSDREPVKTGAAATGNVVRQRSQTKSPESERQPSERSIAERERQMEVPVTSQGVGRTHHSIPPSPAAPMAPSASPFPPQAPAYSVPHYPQYQAFGPAPDGSAGHALPMPAGWPGFPPPPDVPSPSFSDQLGGYPLTYQMGPPGQPLLHFLQGVSAGVPLPPWEPPVGFHSHSALGLPSPPAAPPGFPPLQLSGGLLSGYPPFPQNPLAGLPVYSQEPAGGPACGLAPASASAAGVSPALTAKDKPSSRRYLRVINTVKISPTAPAKSKESVIVEVTPACRQEKSPAFSPGPTGNSDPPQLSEGLKPKQKKRLEEFKERMRRKKEQQDSQLEKKDPDRQKKLPGKACKKVKNVWICGHSLVFWAEKRAKSPEYGMQLGMDPNCVRLWWKGTQGMTWDQLLPFLLQMKGTWPNPDVIIMHVGGNDLGKSKPEEFILAVRKDLMSMKSIFPDCLLVWSNILPRGTWRTCGDAAMAENIRRLTNDKVKREMGAVGGAALSHGSIQVDSQLGLYRPDGVHLSDAGIDMFNLDMQHFLEKWASEVP